LSTKEESSTIASSTDREYLRYQYGDSEKLRIRAETHRRYTAGPDTFVQDLLQHLALPGPSYLLDVGCGNGSMHPTFGERGVHVIGLDTSAGMLREARAAAAKGSVRAHYVQGDAQELPIPDSSFDRVLAAHMLFHVPDRAKALNEMRRVLRPGGRVVLTTNGAEAMQRLMDVHDEAARELGYVPLPEPERSWFTLDDLPLVQLVFPAATRHVINTALVFPASEPALHFYATGRIDRIRDTPSDGSHRPPLLARVREKIDAIIETDGQFRVPKSLGFFVADE
jgi:SAM-dependent methyltransferase